MEIRRMNPSRLLVAILLLARAAAGQNFVLDIPEGSNVPVQASQMIPVQVVYTGDDAAVKSFKVLASRFVSDQDSVSIDILATCDANGRQETQPVAVQLQDGRTASLCLRIPELKGDGKYS